MSYGYIYKTTNLVNNKIYIGQKKGKFNPDYLGSGKLISMALLKYGKNNFKVKFLLYADNKSKLNKLEIKYIKKYRKLFLKENTYNIAEGGIWGNAHLGYKDSEETKIKKRLCNIGSRNPFYGKKHSKKTKEKISKINTGRIKTITERRHHALVMTGRPSGMLGKHHSIKTKKLISKILKGRKTWNTGLKINKDKRIQRWYKKRWGREWREYE